MVIKHRHTVLKRNEDESTLQKQTACSTPCRPFAKEISANSPFRFTALLEVVVLHLLQICLNCHYHKSLHGDLCHKLHNILTFVHKNKIGK